jgi:hypothetical protein
MSVTEYLNKFTHLSHYALDEVNTDPKRQERFLDGLIGPLNYQLQSHIFPDFHTLVNKAIGQWGWRAKGRKWVNRNASFSRMDNLAATPVLVSVLSSLTQYRPGGHGGRYPQNMQLQRSFQPQRFNPQTPRDPTPQLSRPNNGSGAPIRNTNPVQPSGCFKCGELGHYANNCPKRVMQDSSERQW